MRPSRKVFAALGHLNNSSNASDNYRASTEHSVHCDCCEQGVEQCQQVLTQAKFECLYFDLN